MDVRKRLVERRTCRPYRLGATWCGDGLMVERLHTLPSDVRSIEPRKPSKAAYVESFSGRGRQHTQGA
jgi:hypothetical protein